MTAPRSLKWYFDGTSARDVGGVCTCRGHLMPPVYIMDASHDCMTAELVEAVQKRVSEVLKVVSFRRLYTTEKLSSIQ